MNPFTGSINRKGYLIWNAVLTISYYITYTLVNSTAVLIAGGIISALLSILVVVRRMQNTELNLWLLLAVLLPVANIVLWISLFMIPPNSSDAVLHSRNSSIGFKTTIGLVLAVFIAIMLIMIGPRLIGS